MRANIYRFCGATHDLLPWRNFPHIESTFHPRGCLRALFTLMLTLSIVNHSKKFFPEKKILNMRGGSIKFSNYYIELTP